MLARQSTAWRNPGGTLRTRPAGPGRRRDRGEWAKAVRSLPPTPRKTRRCGASAYPAFHVSTFGAGRVVYFAAGVDKAMFFYPDGYQRQVLRERLPLGRRRGPASPRGEGPLILTATFRRSRKASPPVVHLLNQASSWGMHSTYQKLAPLPEEVNRQWGYPNRPSCAGPGRCGRR